MWDEAVEEQHVAASHWDDMPFTDWKRSFWNAKVAVIVHFMGAWGFPGTWEDLERTRVLVHVRQRNPARHANSGAPGCDLWPRDILMPGADPRRE